MESSEAGSWYQIRSLGCPCQQARLEKLGLFLVTAGFKQRLNDQNCVVQSESDWDAQARLKWGETRNSKKGIFLQMSGDLLTRASTNIMPLK